MKTETPNYTPAQVAILVAAAAQAPLTFEDCERLAADPRMFDAEGNPRKARSIVAKITRDGIPYAKKVPVRKDGSKVETKAAIVADIAAKIGVTVATLDGLDKAPRGAVIAVRDYVASVG